jgi:hypothetical protein
MIRRPPTRIELKLDDIAEYEQIRKTTETKKTSTTADAHSLSEMASTKSKAEIIRERIGFDPTPKSPK